MFFGQLMIADSKARFSSGDDDDFRDQPSCSYELQFILKLEN